MISLGGKIHSAMERYRVLTPIPKYIVRCMLLVATALAIYYIFGIVIADWLLIDIEYYYLIMAILFPIAFLVIPARRPRDVHRLPWYDIICASLAFVVPVCFAISGREISVMGWSLTAPSWAVVAGVVLWALAIELARRAGGLFLACFATAVSVLPLFSGAMPGILKGTSFSVGMATRIYAFSPVGFLGVPFQVIARLIPGFLIFAAALQATGGGDAFLKFSVALLGRFRGGPAKVAVVSSGLFGSITGSVISNVATTGAFTIPMMKKSGYSADNAGAIEACASTGGVLMPPIMGAAAFVMATFLGVQYATVALAALIPSLLFYISLLVQVDGYAALHNLKGWASSEIPRLGPTLKEGYVYLFSFFVLIWVLFVWRFEARAAFYAVAVLIGIVLIRQIFRSKGIIDFLKGGGRILGEVIDSSAHLLAEVGAILGPLGLVIGSLLITGIATSLSSSLVALSGGNIALLIVFGAGASFILGMGLTITACYVLLAVILAPALIAGGLDPLAVHLFIMYCGMLSYITPPVAVAAFIASSLAEAPAMKVGLRAVQRGIALFFIPFFFVLEPAFIGRGTPVEIIHIIGTGLLGIVLLASAMEGYLAGVGKLGFLMRFLTFACGVLFLLPTGFTDIIAGSIVALVGFYRLVLLRKRGGAI